MSTASVEQPPEACPHHRKAEGAVAVPAEGTATSAVTACPVASKEDGGKSGVAGTSSPLLDVLKAQLADWRMSGASPNSTPPSAPAQTFNGGESFVASPPSACPRKNGTSGCTSEATSGVADDLSTSGHAPLTFVDGGEAALSDLPTQRQVSSIPRRLPGQDDVAPPMSASASTSASASNVTSDKEKDYWIYPSQKQFYDAMKRKNYQPSEDDMAVLVPLHNIVNEMAWRKVMEWERKYQSTCGDIRLKRFTGKPDDLSPKARALGTFGYKRPFDRHDWVVDRCGQEVRYIIDFYEGKAPSSADQGRSAMPMPLINIHIDARPAMDGPQSVWDRLVRWVME